MSEERRYREPQGTDRNSSQEKVVLMDELRGYGQRVLRGVPVPLGDRSRIASRLKDVRLEASHGDLPTLRQKINGVKDELDGIEYRWVSSRFAGENIEAEEVAQERMLQSLRVLQAEMRYQDQGNVDLVGGIEKIFQLLWNETICVDALLRQRQYGRAARFQMRASRRLERLIMHTNAALSDPAIVPRDACKRFRVAIYRFFDAMQESLNRAQGIIENHLDGIVSEDVES